VHLTQSLCQMWLLTTIKGANRTMTTFWHHYLCELLRLSTQSRPYHKL
jgi:hypothetical protein